MLLFPFIQRNRTPRDWEIFQGDVAAWEKSLDIGGAHGDANAPDARRVLRSSSPGGLPLLLCVWAVTIRPGPPPRLAHTVLEMGSGQNCWNIFKSSFLEMQTFLTWNHQKQRLQQACSSATWSPQGDSEAFVFLSCRTKKILLKLYQVCNENLSSFPILTSKYSKGLLLCSKFYSQKEILNKSPPLWGILQISWCSFLMDLSRKLILRSIIE